MVGPFWSCLRRLRVEVVLARLVGLFFVVDIEVVIILFSSSVEENRVNRLFCERIPDRIGVDDNVLIKPITLSLYYSQFLD